MKKRDFSSLVGAEAIRLSEGHFNLVVESLDNPPEMAFLARK